jgi:hypothetical protein
MTIILRTYYECHIKTIIKLQFCISLEVWISGFDKE